MKNAEIYNRCAFIVGIATKESSKSEENHSIVRKREKPVMSKTFLIWGFTPTSFISPLREEMIFCALSTTRSPLLLMYSRLLQSKTTLVSFSVNIGLI